MSLVLGLDTSNYSTSAALYDSDSGELQMRSQLLPVKPGDCGLRQSDAVFLHTRQLPDVISAIDFSGRLPDAVCASATPTGAVGSYMPCFLVGRSTAQALSHTLGTTLYIGSHQQGHIMAALFSAGAMNLLDSPFFAFHVSGGTTEVLLVTPDDNSLISCSVVAHTLDLNSGQLIDRIGVALGLDFPCGRQLELLALQCTDRPKVKPVLRDCDCCLSGFENKIKEIYAQTGDRAHAAMYTLRAVGSTVAGMTEAVRAKHGLLPVIYAGGVMSDVIIADMLRPYDEVYFASPDFSRDNAAGIAVLGAYLHSKQRKQ